MNTGYNQSCNEVYGRKMEIVRSVRIITTAEERKLFIEL